VAYSGDGPDQVGRRGRADPRRHAVDRTDHPAGARQS
jgi:hypothetical protein